MTQIILRFEIEPVSLRIARKQAAAAAVAVGASPLDVQKIELAAGEALTNAYVHGYRSTRGPVEMEIVYDGGQFAIAVRDEGRGLPSGAGFPGPPDPDGRSGHGLRLIKELMDEVQIVQPRPPGRGTTTRMVIRLT